MFKIINIIFLISFMLVVNSFAASYGPLDNPFKIKFDLINKNLKTSCAFFGRSLRIKAVEYTGKRWLDKNDNVMKYVYRLIIQRPSNDRGDGTLVFHGARFRLYYWVGLGDRSSPYYAIMGGQNVFQSLNGRNDDVIVYFNSAFAPGKYRIKVAVFPSPYIGSKSLRDITLSDSYKMLNINKKIIDMALMANGVLKLNIAKTLAQEAGKKALEGSFIYMMLLYGSVIDIYVPALVPRIVGRYDKDAKNILRMYSLVPNPDYNNSVDYTKKKNVVGRVSRAKYAVGYRLKPNSLVPYKFWSYKKSSNTPYKPQPAIPTREIKETSYSLIQAGDYVGIINVVVDGKPRNSGGVYLVRNVKKKYYKIWRSSFRLSPGKHNIKFRAFASHKKTAARFRVYIINTKTKRKVFDFGVLTNDKKDKKNFNFNFFIN